MRVRCVSGLLATAACMVWLAGCETTAKLPGLAGGEGHFASAVPGGETAGAAGVPGTGSAAAAGLLGQDPNDELSVGKNYFRQGNFGLAERHFRKAVERHPNDLESWVGLAASYDRLARYDLADRAYAQAIKIGGATPEILNNQGFSYMLRGDHRRARATLRQALAQSPSNPYVKNNLKLLAESERKARAVR